MESKGDQWTPQKLERFHRRLKEFREAHETVLRNRAKCLWTIQPERGAVRHIFLVADDDAKLLSFLDRRTRALAHLVSANRAFGGRLAKSFWVPSTASGCDHVYLKAYSASSVRPVDEAAANRFMGRCGVRPPRGAWEYKVRSSTGNRYFAHVRTELGKQEVPLTEWSIFGVTDKFRQRSTSKLVHVSDSVDVTLWGRANGWRWMCGKGQSNLYGRQV